MAEAQDEEARRLFTSWKWNVLDAINSDTRISPSAAQTAYWIMHHINGVSLLANPSMDRLAAQQNLSRFTVSENVKRLAKAGWLVLKRAGRTDKYVYRFDDAAVADMLDARLQREEAAKDIVADRRLQSHYARTQIRDVEDSPHRDVENIPHRDVEDSLVCDVEDSPPQHLSPDYLSPTPEDIAREGEASQGDVISGEGLARSPNPAKSSKIEAENKNRPSAENFLVGEWLDGGPLPIGAHLPTLDRPNARNEYAAARDVDQIATPFPIPTDRHEAETMIDEMCQGVEINAAVRRRMVSMLETGTLTPRLFNGMMNPQEAGAA